MFPPLRNRPSLHLVLSLLLLVMRLPPAAAFSGHESRPHKIPDSTPNHSVSQQQPLVPTPAMKAELLFSHRSNPFDDDFLRRIDFLKSLGISSFAIANTDKKDRQAMSNWIENLRRTNDQSDTNIHICAQYSIKHQPTPKGGLSCKKADLLQAFKDAYLGADEILLVSGSNSLEPRAWDTVDALLALRDMEDPSATSIAVDYNPYHIDPKNQDRENERLMAELATGLVSRIYFRFGTDLDKLKAAISFYKKAATAKPISVVGSLILPTPKRMRSQTWKGVVLSPEFKSDPSGQQAIALVSEMVKLYKAHDIEIFWEAPGIRSLDEVNTMNKILVGDISSTNDAKGLGSRKSCQRVVDDKYDEFDSNDMNSMQVLKSGEKPENHNYATLDHHQGLQSENKSEDPCLLLFGSHDLRLQDNRALEEAFKRHMQVLPVYLYTQEEREGNWGCPQNTAVAVCLEEALKSLEVSLGSFGFPLIYCNGTSSTTHQHGIKELLYLIEGTGAKAVFWNKEATPEGRERNAYWKQYLESLKLGVVCYQEQSSLLYDVEKIELESGFQSGHFGTLMPFLKKVTKVFGQPPRPTPYFETFRILEEGKPPKMRQKIPPTSDNKNGNITTCTTNMKDLNIVEIRGRQKWDESIRKRFPMSEKAAHNEMENFVRNGMKRYEKERSRADKTGATSMLSPHFRIGTLSPNQLYWRIEDSGLPYEQLKTISRRLIWRDLAYYHLFCFPDMKTSCIRRHYEQMKWVESTDEENQRFEAWKRGMTGYPIVDAGMRELMCTGWMTQSLRMVVASFLTEYLRVNWTKGCQWFHYTLVDADSAINSMMWQNAGRSGIDQWNFVLSPKTASQDPTGAYTKKWVPELSALPTTSLLHRPWEATDEVLRDAGIVLGQSYPHRIVTDLKHERQQSIKSTLEMRRKSQEYNSEKGYDLIDLPNGKKSVVFTKKEYRIDKNGEVLKQTQSETKSKRTRKRRKTKVLAQQQKKST